MKIFIVGSAHSLHIRKICESLVGFGHTVELYSLEPANHELAPQVYPESVSVHDNWPFSGRKRKAYFLLKLNYALIAKRADIVWFIYASSYGLLAEKIIAPCKKIISVWGTDILVNSYKGAYQRNIMNSLNSADLVFSTSHYLRTHTQRVTTSPIYLTPYGPDDAFYDNPKGQIDISKLNHNATQFSKTIVCTKWLKNIYGIDILLEAMNLGADFFRAEKIGLIISGSGADAQIYYDYVDEHELNDIVVFTGYLNQPDIIALLDKADLAVYPSRSESFGVSVLECFTRKVPVIMSSVGGFLEVSQRREFGEFTSSENAEAYLSKIKQILSSGASYDLDDACAYAEQFRWSSCMSRIDSALKGIKVTKPINYQHHEFFESDAAKKTVLYSHSESLYCEKDQSRARSIRVSGMRDALQDKFNVIEFGGGGQPTPRKAAKLVADIFKKNALEFVYVEGTAAKANSREIAKSNAIYKNAAIHGVKVIQYLPDAHEFSDDYFFSTQGKAWMVHLARETKRKTIRNMHRAGIIFAVPTLRFRDYLIDRLPKAESTQFASSQCFALPPAVDIRPIIEPTNDDVVFVYAGGLGPFYKLHRFIMGFSLSDVTFDAVFHVRDRDINALDDAYKSLIRNSGLDIRHGDLPMQVDAKRAIGVLWYETTAYSSSAVPIKFYSYLQRGWPMVAYKGTHVADLIEEFQLGWVIDLSVGSVQKFLESDVFSREYEQKREAVLEFLPNQTWGNRVEQLCLQ